MANPPTTPASPPLPPAAPPGVPLGGNVGTAAEETGDHGSVLGTFIELDRDKGRRGARLTDQEKLLLVRLSVLHGGVS